MKGNEKMEKFKAIKKVSKKLKQKISSCLGEHERYKKSYFWMMQTRGSDEPETKFYKCEKCKHVWRDYS